MNGVVREDTAIAFTAGVNATPFALLGGIVAGSANLMPKPALLHG
jgi:hypothetical protein